MHRYFIFALVLLLSCGVKQPMDVSNAVQVETGSIFVDSDPQGAAIFLDNKPQNAVTPDTLKNVPIGKHSIKIFLQGYKTWLDSFTVSVKKDTVEKVVFQPQEFIDKSYLYISTVPDSAVIFIDGNNTGFLTPDTLEVEPGQHEIKALKNGFEVLVWNKEAQVNMLDTLSGQLSIFQRVMLESFGNVGCVPCVQGAKNLERFIEEHSGGHYALFEYFANWPQPNDPFYHVAPKDVDQRVNYYQAYSLPTLKMNGATNVDAKDYDQIINNYNAALASQNAPLAVSIRKRKSDSRLHIQIRLYDRENVLVNNQLRLFVALAEDSLHYDNPGGNGLTEFNFVFRQFLSSREGDVIHSTVFTYDKEWPSAWNYSHSKVIAFIQDVASKKIIQTSIN